MPAVACTLIDNNSRCPPRRSTEQLLADFLAIVASAEKGDAKAQLRLGDVYERGLYYVPRDYAAAASWYRKAAEQGDALAQSELARVYYIGRGVAQDYVLAYMWFSLAATKAPNAVKGRRDSVSAEMTPAQMEEAEKLAREWKPTSAQ